MNLFKRNAKKEELNNLVEYLNNHLIPEMNRVDRNVNGLADEIATNGVVRDLRKLQKEFDELRGHTATMITEHDRQLEELGHNGVATAINDLNKEVFEKKKDAPRSAWSLAAIFGNDSDTPQETTLAGKVDAIIEHLGIELSVAPEQKTPAKVVATKIKAPAKKKGRR